MKKLVSVFILVIIIGSGFAQTVKVNGALKVVGTKLVNEKGQPIILRGMSLGWHNWWPRFYNAGAINWLQKDWGCTVIRAAIGVEPDSGYIKYPDWGMEKAKTAIDAAIKDGIYIIVDWHSHHIRQEEAKQFFTKIAKEYGKYANIIYEIFNEPAENTWPEVKAYSIDLIKTIRAIDPDNVILVGSPHWDQDVHIVADDPIKGYKNLMYTLHYYADTHKQELRDRGDYALKKGLPLFISEMGGMSHTGDGPINNPEWMKWIDWSEKNKISWVNWCVTDKKNVTCSVLEPTASSTGPWSMNDLPDWGKQTRSLIRKYNGLRP